MSTTPNPLASRNWTPLAIAKRVRNDRMVRSLRRGIPLDRAIRPIVLPAWLRDGVQ